MDDGWIVVIWLSLGFCTMLVYSFFVLKIYSSRYSRLGVFWVSS